MISHKKLERSASKLLRLRKHMPSIHATRKKKCLNSKMKEVRNARTKSQKLEKKVSSKLKKRPKKRVKSKRDRRKRMVLLPALLKRLRPRLKKSKERLILPIRLRVMPWL